MTTYFWAALCCAGAVALNFGVICVSLGPSKDFAYENMGIKDGDEHEFKRRLIDGSVFLGCAIGSACIGLLAHLGRRNCMIFIHIMSVIGCLVAAIGYTWWLFMLARLVAGVSVGMSGVAAMYLSEICPRSKRGVYGALYSVFVTFGECMISMWQLSHGESLTDVAKCKCCREKENNAVDSVIWRMGQIYGAIFSLIALYLLHDVVLEDSPFILVKRGLTYEAKRAIGLLQGTSRINEGYREIMDDISAQNTGTDRITLLEALKLPDSRYAILVTFGIAMLRQLCGIYVFTLSASELFGEIVGKGLLAAALGSLCPVVNFLVCCFLPLYIDKFGRRTLLVYGSGIGTAVLAVAMVIQTACGNGTQSGSDGGNKCKCCCCNGCQGECCEEADCCCCKKDKKCCCKEDTGCTSGAGKCCCAKNGVTHSCCSQKCANLGNVNGAWHKYFMIVSCLIFVACFSTGYGGVSWMYFSEALAPEYRDAAYAGASVINWLTAAFVVSTAKPLLTSLGKDVYWVYVVCSGISCLFAVLFVKETAGVPLGQAYVGATTPEIFNKIGRFFGFSPKDKVSDAAQLIDNMRAMKSYFVCSLVLAAIVAYNFGLNTVSFSVSKEFAIVDMGWCKGEAKAYECPLAITYSSLIAGGTFVGGAIGSLCIGFFARFGRRKGMILIHLINILGSLMATASTCFTMFLVGRIIAGVSVGASGLVAMFLTEICTSETRGAYGTIYPMFIALGQLLMVAWQLLHGRVLDAAVTGTADKIAPSTGTDLITSYDSFVWRAAQFWPIVFSVIALAIMYFVVKDDTPYVLMQEGKEEDAKRVIVLLHGEEKAEEIFAEIKSDVEAQKDNTEKLSLMDALKVPKYRSAILIVCGLSIMQQLSGINIFVANASKLFVTIMGRTFTASVMGLVGILLLVITTTILAFIIDKLGRKMMLLVGIGVSSILLVPAVIVKIAVKADWANYVLVVGCFGYMIGFGLGFGGVMWLYFAEALGTEYKDAAFGVATCLNWTFAAITVMTSDVLLNWNDKVTYSLYAGMGALGFVYVYLFLKETKGIPLGQAFA
ncbi:putative glucose transporter [Babesia sp. Xinjiang]|uniref:putative glucose transporter n=1 Tax=Babesia sp. Xinjiang TaxID=462227 RepID=UPI000A2379BA|nr:putative glucose transporter [Babesia sp. Xinjiang]ORM39636.1 putative glucose transporter [Babesia sp. Xinjiang]